MYGALLTFPIPFNRFNLKLCKHSEKYFDKKIVVCFLESYLTDRKGDKGLVINYGEGGATKWENRGSETFCAPPSRQGKTFRAPPFKEWKLYAPPHTIWLKLQATA